MLGFLRKFQFYIYLIVTVVIVISFSFFGTYSSLSAPHKADKIAFTAVDGTKITEQQLERFIQFIRTDSEEKKMYGGEWGPNFLNDGVIEKNILRTGIAGILVQQYPEEIKKDLGAKLVVEKKFTPYVNPQASFLSVENLWSYLAPDIKENFYQLKGIDDPVSQEGFNARTQLYLAQKKLPEHHLRQILRYQQKQYKWLPSDPNLERQNLSLFGYHFLEDWFGRRFLRLVGEFIINSAIVAEKQGYYVSKEEALQDLLHNAQVSFQENADSPRRKVANYLQYMDEQLYLMGMDRSTAVKIWQQVLLFRRLYEDLGNSAVVSTLPFVEYNTFAKESIDGDIYRLPEPLQLSMFRDMEKLEIYLDHVSTRPKSGEGKLKLPTEFLSPEKVSAAAPELVQKRYLLDVIQVDKEKLQAKVSVKDTWNHEIEPANWEILKKRFPELAVKKGETREQRLDILDHLDQTTRDRIDSFTRSEIVNARPEWLTEAFDKASSKRMMISLRKRGGKFPIAGLKSGSDLMELLDKAELGQENILPELKAYTADEKNYYRIAVIDKSATPEIMTYAEADNEGVLDDLLDRKLEAHYISVRKDKPEGFKNLDGSWKVYAEVKDKVGELYFAPLLKDLTDYYKKNIAAKDAKSEPSTAMLTAIRLYPHMTTIRDLASKDPSAIESHVNGSKEETPEDKLPGRENLKDQWRLDKTAYHTERSSEEIAGNSDIFKLKENEWSKVFHAPNGDTYFLRATAKGTSGEDQLTTIIKQVNDIRQVFSGELQEQLGAKMIKEFKEKDAISFKTIDETEEADEA